MTNESLIPISEVIAIIESQRNGADDHTGRTYNLACDNIINLIQGCIVNQHESEQRILASVATAIIAADKQFAAPCMMLKREEAEAYARAALTAFGDASTCKDEGCCNSTDTVTTSSANLSSGYPVIKCEECKGTGKETVWGNLAGEAGYFERSCDCQATKTVRSGEMLDTEIHIRSELMELIVENYHLHYLPDGTWPLMNVVRDFLRPYLRTTEAKPESCPYCNNTGDVHRTDGEWLGVCTACVEKESLPEPVAVSLERCAAKAFKCDPSYDEETGIDDTWVEAPQCIRDYWKKITTAVLDAAGVQYAD